MPVDLSVLEVELVGEKRQLGEQDKRMVCLLVALGETEEAVARKLEITPKQVSDVIKAPDGIESVIRFQHAAFPDPALRLKKLSNLAIDRLTKILLTGSDTNAAKVGADFLDRSMGKATQVVENRNLNVQITDMAAADRAIMAAEQRLMRLQETQDKLLAAAHAPVHIK